MVDLLNALLDGAQLPTEPMPSSRELSKLLKVSRNTVVLVYEQLVQDGFLTPASRRGYFVNEAFVRQQLRIRIKPVPDSLFEGAAVSLDWGKRLHLRPSAQQVIVKPQNWREFRYPFIYGQVEYDETTAARWRNCNRLATLRAHMSRWVDDQVTLDDPLLVEQITMAPPPSSDGSMLRWPRGPAPHILAGLPPSWHTAYGPACSSATLPIRWHRSGCWCRSWACWPAQPS